VVGAGIESLDPSDIEAAAECFTGLCDRAADHGLLVGMEFMGISAVKDVATAAQIVELAGRPNGGITLDSYHYFRSTSTDADLRALGGNRINCIQLRDGAGPGDWDFHEVTERCLLPGDGDFDLVGMYRTLDDMGVTAPATVEILSLEHWSRPLDEQASASHDATQALLAKARS
jgi:sugar phosphate isomerase/epimerase